ncbi:putative cytochrome P450 oxygenase [Boeremia exigua]|uniref:putative cytochrome P450 oxygenase n=1 Tax=Boeremia exigua TaxID=749465 RepID=UPI001E8D37BF|nr:putative cytochrome P450 oxygenase [Boeremia exigua]KAH6644308.1 putative cytochrome P450 oxygenase [Boeremia exigua]
MAGAIQAIAAKASVGNLLSIRGIAFVLATLVLFQLLQGAARIIYNLYFHPLSKYPGPKLWAAFDVARTIGRMGGYIDLQIAEEHRKHGDVVRIGVDELSFVDPNAWKDIYGHGHAELRKYFPPNAVNPNQIIAADSGNHFRMRRAMLPAFSERALSQQEPLIRVYLDLLIQRLSEYAESGRPADMVRWYNLTTFDLIADLCFGRSLGGLETGESNGWIEKIEKMLEIMPVMMLVTSFPFLMTIFNLVFGRKMQQSRKEHQNYAASLAMGRIQAKEHADRGDFMDYILRSRGEAHEVTDEELVHNADLFMVAGSETTATVLLGVTYYLLKTPQAYKRVTEEIRTAFDRAEDINFKEASTRLPYMLCCLTEAMRIFPSIPLALLRITNDGPPTPIAGHSIPAATRVGVHQLGAYHSPSNFHDAQTFHPERWLPEEYNNPSSPFYNDRRDVHKPFSYGRRDCIGRNLAYLEMRLILALLLWNFDLTLGEGMDQWHIQKIFGLWQKPSLQIRLEKRVRV